MALRPLRNATITFGLVSTPVRFYTATKSEDIHFHDEYRHDLMEKTEAKAQGKPVVSLQRVAKRPAPAGKRKAS